MRIQLVILAGLLLSQNLRAADAHVIRIGILPPLSGLEKDEGAPMLNAAKLAVERVNSMGGVNGEKIELVVADNQSTPEGAVAAYTSLIDTQKVVAVIGSAKSAQGVAIGPKSDTSHIPTIVGGTNPRLTENHPYFFRCRPNDNISSSAIVRFIAEDTHHKKIGIINDSGAFGTGGANLVEKAAREHGLTVVKRETIRVGERNLAPPLGRIKAAGAEVLVSYVPNYVDQAAVEIEHQKMGSPFTFIGSPSTFSRVAIETAKTAVDGLYAALDVLMGQTDLNRSYVEAYKKEFKEEPDPQSSFAYDGIMILANAMRVVKGTDASKIRTAILGLKNYEGLLGTYNFSANGEGLHSVVIAKFEGGKPKLVKRLGD